MVMPLLALFKVISPKASIIARTAIKYLSTSLYRFKFKTLSSLDYYKG
jgi:hypothetical protein